MKILYLFFGLLLPYFSSAQLTIDCEEAKLNFLEYITIDGLIFSRDESVSFSTNLKNLNDVGTCYFHANDSLIKNYNISSHFLQKYPGALMLHFLVFRDRNQLDRIDKFLNFERDSKRDTIQNILCEYMCKKYIRKREFVKAEFKASVNTEDTTDVALFFLLSIDTNNVLKKIKSSDTLNYILPNLSTLEIKKGSDNYVVADNYVRYLFQGETKNLFFVQKNHPLFFANCYLFALNHFYSNERNIDQLNTLLNFEFKINVTDSIDSKIESSKYFYKYVLSSSEFQYKDACKYYSKYVNNFKESSVYSLRRLSLYLFRYTIFAMDTTCNDCSLMLKRFIVKSFEKNKKDIFNRFNYETTAEYLVLEFVKLFATDMDIIKIVDEALLEVRKKENVMQFMNNKDKWYEFLNYKYWVEPINPWDEGVYRIEKNSFVKEKLYSQLKNEIILFAESQGINKSEEVLNPMLTEYCTYYLIAQFLYNKDSVNLNICRYIISRLDKDVFNDKNSKSYYYMEKEMIQAMKYKFFPYLLSSKQIIDTIAPIIIINKTPEVINVSNYETSGFVIDMSVLKSFFINGSPIILDNKNKSFKQNTTLTEGLNTLKYIAEDAYGNTTSLYREITYKPIKDEFLVRKNYALLFAVNDYNENTGWADLMNPISDAESIAKKLVNYGFDTLIIRNPTKADVQKWLYWYAEKKYGKYDQLLIFYSGHGEYDDKLSRGFLALSDSKQSDFYKNNYLSYADISETLDNNSCNHILFISDACFSGTFFKSIASKGKDNKNVFDQTLIKEKLEYKTRLFIGSAGKEESPDVSVFANSLLHALKSLDSKNKVLTYNQIIPYFETLKPQSTNGQFGSNEPGGTFILERDFGK